MVKLLVNCGAIHPRLWAEMALQILCNPKKLSKKLWGIILEFISFHFCGYDHNIDIKLHIRMHIFSEICLRELTWNNLDLNHKLYMKWFRTEHKDFIPLKKYYFITQHNITSKQSLTQIRYTTPLKWEKNTWKLVTP